jgi:alginate O-acetyltransferase complex protein AlgI
VVENLSALLGEKSEFSSPALPIGISFYTFQVLTYTVDVYKGKSPVQKNYGKLLLYVSFFPQLIAGPIVNYSDIAPYLDQRKPRFEDVYEGFIRFFIGFAKKILIANPCGVIVEKIAGVSELSLMGAWTLAIAYTLQIYFDFSGYSDMAIGMGRLFGFRFLENFNYPYISKSVTEFWRRWHISLGSFFREYVYIPLGGNRVSKGRLLCNLMVVWMLTGVWHGASWNFILWGLYYGVLLVLEKFFLLKIKERLPGVVNVAITLLLVIIGWILFYYVDLSEGLHHLAVMFGITASPLTDVVTTYYLKHYLVFVIAGIVASVPWKAVFAGCMGAQTMEKYQRHIEAFATLFKPIVTTILFLASMSVLIGQSYNPFLYFRF